MKTLNGMKRTGAEALKRKFLQCFDGCTTSATTQQGVVKGLIDRGVSRRSTLGFHPSARHILIRNGNTTNKAGNRTRGILL